MIRKESIVSDIDILAVTEINTEITSELDTELSTEVSDPVLPEVNINVEEAVYSALDSYFAENVVLVRDESDMDGINKQISDFSLTEVCLVLIVLILLGASILKLIGGRVWNRL